MNKKKKRLGGFWGFMARGEGKREHSLRVEGVAQLSILEEACQGWGGERKKNKKEGMY